MTAHNSYQDYDLSTPVDMTFDEVFPDVYAAATDDTATMDATTAKPHHHHQQKQQQRYDSAPYDESIMMPTLAPVSPCYSDESTASSTTDATPTHDPGNLDLEEPCTLRMMTSITLQTSVQPPSTRCPSRRKTSE